jgi:hypothetical protein
MKMISTRKVGGAPKWKNKEYTPLYRGEGGHSQERGNALRESRQLKGEHIYPCYK